MIHLTNLIKEQINKPKAIIIAAAKVGGINANNIYKGEFIYDNITIQSRNVA